MQTQSTQAHQFSVYFVSCLQSQWFDNGQSKQVTFTLTRQCSSKKFVHVASTRILQQHLANSLEVAQSRVPIEKLSIRMAKPLGTSLTRPQYDKAEKWTKRLQDKQWSSIHSCVCRRFTFHWTRQHCQWICFQQYKSNCCSDLQVSYQRSKKSPSLGEIPQTKVITMRSTSTSHTLPQCWKKQAWQHAKQQEFQGRQQTRQAMTPKTQYNCHQRKTRTLHENRWKVTVDDLRKELARSLQQPKYLDMKKMKHTLRYLQGTKDYKFILRPTTLPRNKDIPTLDVYVDADWAGCTTTRKSTTGCAIKYLGATIHFGSRTQAIVALSSAESELHSIGTGAQEALRIRNFLMETILTSKLQIRIHTDSTSGKSIATRIGSSKKAKHIDLKYLFIQQLVHNGILAVHKIGTLDNIADIFTKYVTAEVLNKHLYNVGLLSPNNNWHFRRDSFTSKFILTISLWTLTIRRF